VTLSPDDEIESVLAGPHTSDPKSKLSPVSIDTSNDSLIGTVKYTNRWAYRSAVQPSRTWRLTDADGLVQKLLLVSKLSYIKFLKLMNTTIRHCLERNMIKFTRTISSADRRVLLRNART
jgi:hypothetical protein